MADRFRRNGQARQAVEWTNIPAFNLALSGDGTSIGAGLLSATSRFTVRRVRGRYSLRLSGTLAASDEVRLGIGLCVVSTDAAVAGAGSIPDVLGDADFSWMYWAEHRLMMPGAATSATWDQPGGWGPAVQERWYDVKAMRKMKTDESLIWSVQYSDEGGTPPIEVDFGIARVLIGLH